MMLLCILHLSLLSYFLQGVMEIHPGAVNSIPSKAHVEIGMLLAHLEFVLLIFLYCCLDD